MGYSITFKKDGTAANDRNTWSNWKLVPDSPLMVSLPEMETNYIDIPGRRAGPIDASTFLTGSPTYKRATGSWNFYREIENVNTRLTLYHEMRRYLTGRIIKMVVEDEPTYYYKGRFTVSLPKSTTNPLAISISYDLEPVRYLVSNDSIDPNYPDEV